MNIIAAKAVCFKENLTPERRRIHEQIVRNSKVLAETMLNGGFDLVSGGTDNHLMLCDLTNKKITGKDAEAALGEAGVTVNKNTVPYDKEKPFVTSGIRVGTPCVTIRGMREAEMRSIGGWMGEVVANPADSKTKAKVRAEAGVLCAKFPVYR